MRFSAACYQMAGEIGARLACLRPAQAQGLSLWVYGTIMAGSCCQDAVATALVTVGEWHALRQRLREVLYAGTDKRRPCATQIDVRACFAPLLGWVLAWWQGKQLALAVDATLLGDRLAVLVVSVLYRGCAIPVAWHVLPANREGVWIGPILCLLRMLRPAVDPRLEVVVLADRGLWSPRLWKRIRDLGWHPLLRLQTRTLLQPVGGRRQSAKALVAGPGHAWVGRATAFKHAPVRRAGTAVVVWAPGQAEPWVLLTDLPPDRVGVAWYGMRAWIELGFRALKGVGWRWDKTRRLDPERAARHWLVLSLASLWTLAYGTRAEDAHRCHIAPAVLIAPPMPIPLPAPTRRVSVFARGRSWLRTHLPASRLWDALWLAPHPWPQAPPGLSITYHDASLRAVA